MSNAPPRDPGDAAAIGRRGLLGGLAAGSALAGHAAAAGAAARSAPLAGAPPPEPMPPVVTLLVAGPRGGRIDQWAALIGPALARALPAGTEVERLAAGGADGVTAANRFDTGAAPDGGTALLLPGATALAWLAGDPRARFDAASWLPVVAGVTPGVLVSRVPLAAVRAGRTLRVAASAPLGPEMPALLALDLMGVEAVPVIGLHPVDAAPEAAWASAADAMFVTGPDTMRLVAAAAQAGAAPLFTLGAPGEAGPARDRLLPDVPSAAELTAARRGAAPSGPLYAAWRAAASAAALEFALVLPRLTPASLIAVWRRAGTDAVAAASLQDRAPGVRLVAALEASAAASVACDAAALLELRRWLATRLGWQPS